MALKDLFKKKKKKPEEPVKVEPKPKQVKKPVKVKPQPVKPKRRSKFGRAEKIIRIPHMTEKASDLVDKNQYAFKIWPRANKSEVKKAIENVFGVDVVSVRIINVVPKKRRLGRIEGARTGYKKAIVKIKEGQKIEVLPR